MAWPCCATLAKGLLECSEGERHAFCQQHDEAQASHVTCVHVASHVTCVHVAMVLCAGCGCLPFREKLAAYVARMLRIAPVAGVIPRYLPDVLKGQLGSEFF